MATTTADALRAPVKLLQELEHVSLGFFMVLSVGHVLALATRNNFREIARVASSTEEEKCNAECKISPQGLYNINRSPNSIAISKKERGSRSTLSNRTILLAWPRAPSPEAE
ncbi:hypothetical protein ACVWXO_000423 [Bradyrhizobium sp. LM2.7]